MGREERGKEKKRRREGKQGRGGKGGGGGEEGGRGGKGGFITECKSKTCTVSFTLFPEVPLSVL